MVKQAEPQMSDANNEASPQANWFLGTMLSRKHRAAAISILTVVALIWSDPTVRAVGTAKIRQCGIFGDIVTAYHKELGRAGGPVAGGRSRSNSVVNNSAKREPVQRRTEVINNRSIQRKPAQRRTEVTSNRSTQRKPPTRRTEVSENKSTQRKPPSSRTRVSENKSTQRRSPSRRTEVSGGKLTKQKPAQRRTEVTNNRSTQRKLPTRRTEVSDNRLTKPRPAQRRTEASGSKLTKQRSAKRGTEVNSSLAVNNSAKRKSPSRRTEVTSNRLTQRKPAQRRTEVSNNRSTQRKPPSRRTEVGSVRRTIPPGTSSRASASTRDPVCRLFDQFGAVNGCDVRARLDNFALELQNDPTAQGYIIVYNGARRTRRNYAQELADASKNYLFSQRGVSPDRIVTVDGGRRQELATELWIVPSGAVPPMATPTVNGEE